MKKLAILFLSVLLLQAELSLAQSFEAGKVYFDDEKWTEFIPGDLPLVISVPHDGEILVPEVPVRDCKGAVTVRDIRSMELAREIQKAFKEKYKLSPSVVICHLSRKNIDQNRELEGATCGNELMEKPWNAFHDYIDTALAIAVRNYGSCMYIDLHGHGHPNQRLELGYSINKDDLPRLDSKGDLSDLAKKSSLYNLLQMNPKLNFKDLMIGKYAFGTMIANAGTPAIPSKQTVATEDGERYFNGGYNTRRYTSEQYPKVFGWQIESNFKGVRDAAGRPVFARAFADVIMKYFKENTLIKLPE